MGAFNIFLFLFLIICFLLSLQLDRALQMQRELLESQSQRDSMALPQRLVRDGHKYVETFLANCSEETARTYSLEIIRLATGLVDYSNKVIAHRPRITVQPPTPMDPGAHGSSLSPILPQPSQRPAVALQRSWIGHTPVYRKVQGTLVAGGRRIFAVLEGVLF